MHSMSIVRSGLVVALFTTAVAAQAEEQSPSQRTFHEPPACRAMVLRSAGYRDIIARFPERQATRDAGWAAGFQTSYRDAALRLPFMSRQASPGRDRALPRYVLLARPWCG